jgi:hypothetical protein
VIRFINKKCQRKTTRTPKTARKELWMHAQTTFDLEEHDRILLTSMEDPGQKKPSEDELRGHRTLKNKYEEIKLRPEVADHQRLQHRHGLHTQGVVSGGGMAVGGEQAAENAIWRQMMPLRRRPRENDSTIQ